jgi:hypothetical protein
VSPMLQAQNSAIELYELLLQNASLFGRLVQLAGWWNPELGRYERGLPERFKHAGLDHAISKWRLAFFNEWLALSLTQQQNDVTIFWSTLGRTREAIQKIRDLGEAAIPPLVDLPDRRAFQQSLTFVQSLLTHDAKASGTAA